MHNTSPAVHPPVSLEHYQETHEKFIYPVVRVLAPGPKGIAGGSGVVVYSQDKETYILTNHHVIDNLITIESKWNSVAQRKMKIETRAEAVVEFFDYEDLSRITDANAKRAQVVAWDDQMDLALVQLNATAPVQYVSPIMHPKDERERLFISTPVRTVGCGLGVPPLMTIGAIGGFDFMIENMPYTLCTAPSIFGNSGGPVYNAETGEVVGISARVAVAFIGFGGSAITHMSYSIPTRTIYSFLENHFYDFIIDPSVDREESHKKRESLRKKSLEAQLTGGEEESSPSGLEGLVIIE